MTKFVVNGKERELRYDVSGVDISGDFIGGTAHEMDEDSEGRYIASQEEFDWWRETILAHQKMNETIAAYKERFDSDEVDRVAQDWAGGDLDIEPEQVVMGLNQAFGSDPRCRYRCKFECDLPVDTYSTPERQAEVQTEWMDTPPDGGLPLCPLAYRLCHSPCDALQSEYGDRFAGKIEGQPV